MRHLEARLLGADTRATFARVVALVVSFLALDQLADRAVRIRGDAVLGEVLLLEAVAARPLEFVALLVGAGATMVIGRERVWSSWVALEKGAALRALAAPLIVLMVWRHGFYGYHYVYDQWHALDRTLVVALGAAALWRPVFLIPFVIETRIVGEQFVALFGLTSGRNIDVLLLLVLLALGVAHAWYVLTGHRRTAPVVLLISAVIAAFFFHPGVSKLRIDWFDSELANFARSSYIAGWVGAGDGGWSRRMADFADTFRLPVMVGTMVLEVGALIAVIHHRLLRWWLPGWALFHITIFAWSGFWLFEWVVLEAALFVLLSRPGTREWLAENFRPARVLLAMAVVVGGPVLLDPPGLAWHDAPVSHAYRVEVVGESGTEYNLALEQLEPLAGDVSFLFANLDDRRHPVAAYGAAFAGNDIDALEAIAGFDDLDDYRAALAPVRADQRMYSELLFTAFVDHVNERGRSPWWLVEPPPRFWTSAPEPTYDYQEDLTELRVFRVDALHEPGLRRDTLALTVTVGADGAATVAG